MVDLSTAIHRRFHSRKEITLPLALAAAGLFAGAASRADVKLPTVISDNMVLQQGMKAPVWGQADPGEVVTVTFNGKSMTATAGGDGRWEARLPRLKAGGPYEMTVAGKNSVTVRNILVGEVWIGSGQSNMEMSVGSSKNAAEEIRGSADPKIRLFTVAKHVATQPASDVEGRWVECGPETVPGFSAAAYFFGRRLRKSLGVPVGLIHSSWGGTPAESWTRRETLTANPDLKGIVDRWDRSVLDYPKEKADYERKLVDWTAASEQAKVDGKDAPKKPDAPGDPNTNPWLASSLFNGMIAPLVPYGIKGAIWYQGESNAGRAYQYRTLFPTMIRDWRGAWGQGDFPFLFVQLANFTATNPGPVESDWAELREAQSMTLQLPKTGMAVIIDLGEANDIHPKNKQDVGLRLALSAEKIAYRKHGVSSGPVYRSMTVEGDSIHLQFETMGGLAARDNGPLKGFAIAGADRKFVWAEASIDGDTAIVRSAQVPHPIAVRYAWSNNPECNLTNPAGLPASPFRTDEWPGVTVNNR